MNETTLHLPATVPEVWTDAFGLRWLAECGSTNDAAWAMLEAPQASGGGEDAGAGDALGGREAAGEVALPRAVVALRQTAGRGRRGRSWSAPVGSGLTLSIGLRPSLPPEQGAALPLVAAVAVADVCLALGVTPWLKWPNDVRVGGSKLAGILCEARSRGAEWWAVVGIGLNVRTPPEGWPPEVPAIALDAAGATGSLRLEDLAPAVVAAFEARLAEVERAGFAVALAAFSALAPPPGTRLTQAGRTGYFAGLAPDGALLLRDDAGTVQAIRTGEVELVGAPPAR